jgi:protein gp37
MNRATSATGWVRNPVMISPDLDPSQASSYELGWTHNPLTGCLNHVNGLCKGGGFPCYAYKLANGRLKQKYLVNNNIAYSKQFKTAHEDPFHPRFWQSRLSEPIEQPTPEKPAKRKGIFVCDMGELFGNYIPRAWQEEIFTTIKLCPYHRFYLLTKQPQNLVKFSPFPENCWVGVTITNQHTNANANLSDSLRALIDIDAKVKFVSFEPLLEEINVSFYPDEVQWLIIGACTGTYVEMLDLHHRLNGYVPATRLMRLDDVGRYTLQPRVEWIREIVEAADGAKIPVFLKDNLKPVLEKSLFVGDTLYWAEESDECNQPVFKLRQEFPKE